MGFEPATTSLQTVFSVHSYVMFKTTTIVDTILCVMVKLRKKKELPPPIWIFFSFFFDGTRCLPA